MIGKLSGNLRNGCVAFALVLCGKCIFCSAWLQDWAAVSCVIVILQVLSLLHDSTVRGPIFRAAVAVLEGMQARHSDLANQLVTKPLIEPLLKCLDSAGKVVIFHFIVTLKFIL